MGRLDVGEMLDEMDPLEFYSWWVHFSNKLTPSERGDIGLALSAFWVVKVLCCGLGVKAEDVGHKGPFTPSTFAPWQPLLKEMMDGVNRPQSEAEMKQRLLSAANKGNQQWQQ